MRSFILVVGLLLSSISVAYAGPCIVKAGYLVAVSEPVFEKATSMIVQGDKVAFEKMAKAGLCGITKEGTRVFLVDWGLTRCEVRPEGATGTVWINSEALQCN